MAAAANILIVDDEPRLASLISRTLFADGFAVDSTGDGTQALKLLRAGSYDLMVLDLRLPGLDGFSVLERTMSWRKDQRVFVLSALSDVESKIRALELGASDYLSKPFALGELVARIKAQLRTRGAAPAERFLQVGRLTLDLQRRTADVGEGSVALSTREFVLLEYLMRKRGEVCRREELLANVWGYSFDPGSNVVDVYVRRLRSKLGSEIIGTVRDVGYYSDDADAPFDTP